jgi:hypothetical protein
MVARLECSLQPDTGETTSTVRYVLTSLEGSAQHLCCDQLILALNAMPNAAPHRRVEATCCHSHGVLQKVVPTSQGEGARGRGRDRLMSSGGIIRMRSISFPQRPPKKEAPRRWAGPEDIHVNQLNTIPRPGAGVCGRDVQVNNDRIGCI